MARKPRARRGRQGAPRATKGGREAAIAQKARIVSLEARVTMLERSVWSGPMIADDDARLLAKHPILEEE